HRRAPARRLRGIGHRPRPAGPVRRRDLVPDARRAVIRRAVRAPPLADRGLRRPAGGYRRRDPRPADGGYEPPAARARERAARRLAPPRARTAPAAARGRPRRRPGARAASRRPHPPRYRRPGGTRPRSRRREHRRHGPRARARQPLRLDHPVGCRRRRGGPRGRARRRARLPRSRRRMKRRFEPAGPLRGRVTPPPDKSISHRAALFGAMSDEPVRIVNYLGADDTLATLDAIRSLGAGIEEDNGDVLVRGVGLRTAAPTTGGILNVGNAGTLLRILPGWLAGQPGGIWRLDGDESIRRRPVERIV